MASFNQFVHSGFGRFINKVARRFVPYKDYGLDPSVDARRKTASERLAEEINSSRDTVENVQEAREQADFDADLSDVEG